VYVQKDKYNKGMQFEWDANKNRSNIRKHSIPFEIAQEVFEDPFCVTTPDRFVGGEERLWTVGCIDSLAILVVVHTLYSRDEDEVVRIISARKATPRERRLYEEAER
jgi:hypothetical protein